MPVHGGVIASILLLGFVSLERLSEMVIAEINTRRLKAKGAYEVAAGHYPLFFVLHGGWLAGLWWLGFDLTLIWPWVAAYAVLEAMRLWVMATLGGRWTTRIIVLPGAPLVLRGPYRFLAHPNYAVVVGEILVLPLCFGLTIYAAVFTVLNAAVLFVRIRAENRALTALTGGISSLP
jgi:methyltransferase